MLTTIGSGLALAVVSAASIGMFPGSSPSLIAPCGLPLIIPLFMGAPLGLVLCSAPLVYWAWVWPVVSGRNAVPRSTFAVVIVLLVLSLTWFVKGWALGVQYEGRLHTAACLAISLVLITAAGLLALRGRAAPSVGLRLSSHWLILAWLASYGFPYLGETP